MTLSRQEIAAIRTALRVALAGEPQWHQATTDAMRSALERLDAAWDALVPLTRVEANALCEAVSQMTDGKARDFNEWRFATRGTRRQWAALVRGEVRLREARG
jgi:hypothetical protein